ncbi:MAG TPA: alkaline phosphatase family protein [Acidimicrobiia bacterium]|nr:alkaline phosphatase family protein [Acidimicrobiia bacterium]
MHSLEESLSRRSLLKGFAVAGAGVAVAEVAGCSSSSKSSQPNPPASVAGSTTTVKPAPLRRPGSRPNPTLPEGTETLPKIKHIVIVMMENHSFDGRFGMLGRGDGFKLDANGRPLDANPMPDGRLLRAFHMPSTCQLNGAPGQNWIASHTAFDNGRNDGFVRASGPVAMGYWDKSDIPFYYGLAGTFPLLDRYFCSVQAQTYPNRRFLIAGTASGVVSTSTSNLDKFRPANGTILDRLHRYGISWRNYFSDLPGTAVILKNTSTYASNLVSIDQFYRDATAGSLPAVSYVDPRFNNDPAESEENPDDIAYGENFVSKVVNAVFNSPNWKDTVLIYTYDEHGGYYDHVPPPRAIKPDNIAPGVDVTEHITGAYDHYGFRVPTVIVSPYAKRNYVSSVVHDHTSVMKLIETKWNLGALTYRDANASDLLDSLDLEAAPAFAEPPTLPAPGKEGLCVPGKPGGPIPPPDAIVPASQASSLRVGATA